MSSKKGGYQDLEKFDSHDDYDEEGTDDESIEYVDKIVQDDGYYSPSALMLVCLVVWIILAATGIGLGVYFGWDKIQKDDQESSVSPPTRPPAESQPTVAPTTSRDIDIGDGDGVFVCPLCGDGSDENITIFDAVIAAAGDRTCAQLLEASIAGNINPDQCTLLQPISIESCGCPKQNNNDACQNLCSGSRTISFAFNNTVVDFGPTPNVTCQEWSNQAAGGDLNNETCSAIAQVFDETCCFGGGCPICAEGQVHNATAQVDVTALGIPGLEFTSCGELESASDTLPSEVCSTLQEAALEPCQCIWTEDEILDTLEGVVGPAVRENGTAQALAAQWLLNEDGRFEPSGRRHHRGRSLQPATPGGGGQNNNNNNNSNGKGPCNICGGSNVINNMDGIITTGQGDRTCADLAKIAETDGYTATVCSNLAERTKEPCQCGPAADGSNATDSNSTTAPSDVPSGNSSDVGNETMAEDFETNSTTPGDGEGGNSSNVGNETSAEDFDSNSTTPGDGQGGNSSNVGNGTMADDIDSNSTTPGDGQSGNSSNVGNGTMADDIDSNATTPGDGQTGNSSNVGNGTMEEEAPNEPCNICGDPNATIGNTEAEVTLDGRTAPCGGLFENGLKGMFNAEDCLRLQEAAPGPCECKADGPVTVEPPSNGKGPCNICGGSNVINNMDGIITTGQGDRTCADLAKIAETDGYTPAVCSNLAERTKEPCQCGPAADGSNATDTNSTTAPSDVPSGNSSDVGNGTTPEEIELPNEPCNICGVENAKIGNEAGEITLNGRTAPCKGLFENGLKGLFTADVCLRLQEVAPEPCQCEAVSLDPPMVIDDAPPVSEDCNICGGDALVGNNGGEVTFGDTRVTCAELANIAKSFTDEECGRLPPLTQEPCECETTGSPETPDGSNNTTTGPPKCDLCPGGEFGTLDAKVEVPAIGELTCSQALEVAEAGQVLEDQCPILRDLVKGPCECKINGAAEPPGTIVDVPERGTICSICPGEKPANPDFSVSVPLVGALTCGEVFSGRVEATLCVLLQEVAEEPCGCSVLEGTGGEEGQEDQTPPGNEVSCPICPRGTASNLDGMVSIPLLGDFSCAQLVAGEAEKAVCPILEEQAQACECEAILPGEPETEVPKQGQKSTLSDLSTDAMIQRYLMALLFFQTTNLGTDLWENECYEIGLGEESSQAGSTCLYDDYEGWITDDGMVAEDRPDTLKSAQKWLSESHECSWAGVGCDADLQVEELHLRGFGLLGDLQADILSLPLLNVLDFSYNELTGRLPPAFLKQRGKVYLNHNRLEGTTLGSTRAWADSQIVELNIGSNQLSGTLATEVGSRPDLMTKFWAYNNSLEGRIPPWLLQDTKNSSMEVLHLGENNFTGAVPFVGSSLTRLELWSNQLTGWSGVNESALVTLDLAGNQMEGEFLKSLGDALSLQELRLTNNRFGGMLEEPLFTLTNLTHLSLGGNFFDGEIPEAIANLSSLQVLELDRNNLRGEIPLGVYTLANLTKFDVSANGLNGTIAPEIESLSRLETLFLQDNFFVGTIPSAMENLVNLDMITLYKNDFTGVVPVGLCEGKTTLSADCDEISCDCCTECCSDEGSCTSFNDVIPI